MSPPPYLPEPDPVAPIPATTNGNPKKTLLLWVLLIVMFLGIWQLLTPSGHGAAQAARPPCEPASGPWLGIALGWVPALLFAALLVLLWRTFAGDRLFSQKTEVCRLALAERRFEDVFPTLEALIAAHRKKISHLGALQIFQVNAFMLAGRLEEAVATCIAIERLPNVPFTAGLRILGAAALAQLYGMKGELDAAERWTSEVRTRLAKNADDRMVYAAHLCIAEAIVRVRRGAPREAVAMLDASWTKLRFVLTAHQMLVAEAVRGFAEAQANLREHNAATVRVLRLGEAASGELGFLGREWPEMRAFLEVHGVA